jgi:hypothetical protein
MQPRHLLPALLMLGCLPCAGAGFQALGLPGSQLAALSADGRGAAGGLVDARSGGFRWHEGSSPQLLAGAVSVRAISASGRVVAGTSLDADHREVATWWDADGNAHPLGGLAGADAQAGVLSTAYGITDEPRVVGTASSVHHADAAFAWTSATGMVALGGAAHSSGASAISSNGSRIVGWIASTGSQRHAAVWTDLRPVDATEAGATDELLATNRAGTLVLGIATDADAREIPFRWSPGSRVEPIDTSLARVRLTAASDDGRLLAGAAGSGGQRVAVVWTSARGVEHLADFLAARSIAVPDGWTLIAATAVSSDGHRVGGFGLEDGRFDSFVIDLSSIADDRSHSPTVR